MTRIARIAPIALLALASPASRLMADESCRELLFNARNTALDLSKPLQARREALSQISEIALSHAESKYCSGLLEIDEAAEMLLDFIHRAHHGHFRAVKDANESPLLDWATHKLFDLALYFPISGDNIKNGTYKLVLWHIRYKLTSLMLDEQRHEYLRHIDGERGYLIWLQSIRARLQQIISRYSSITPQLLQSTLGAPPATAEEAEDRINTLRETSQEIKDFIAFLKRYDSAIEGNITYIKTWEELKKSDSRIDDMIQKGRRPARSMRPMLP